MFPSHYPEKGISLSPILLIFPTLTRQETHSSLPVSPRLEGVEGSGGWQQSMGSISGAREPHQSPTLSLPLESELG